MPYLAKTITDTAAILTELKRWAPELVNHVTPGVRLEVHCSSFSDPGEDYSEYRLIDEGGTPFKATIVKGF